ncbi:glycosyltransferase family 25 protein [uncultured Rhodoblastus sp.]|uniref:glycosyltransferase family 25 protein n=1 Tax=uncultured Rhodoblastus sp. TaxID=543037 RepID=UPI0025E96B33|nr:glycosyltransferase family 25 protein [uncultured Rhodoblastus sp.]
MAEPKAFILHLERAAQRRPQVDLLRSALPLASEIVAATDGALLSPQQVDAVYRRQLHRPRFSHPLNRAEIGAFLSHRAAWRQIVGQGLDYALVFEDDAAIDAEAFARTCAFARETRAQWDYALAPAPQTRIAGAVVAEQHGVALIRPKNPPLRAIAQFVSNDAARKLLAATEKFDRPIDTLLQMRWVTGVELLALKPSGVQEQSGALGGSTIQRKSMGLAEKLRHEIARPIYRAQVRAWSAFARKPGK